jgi:23S rRNA pseudouridine2604 synthase
MEENLKRLNKFIGETGYCSRREADKIIEQGMCYNQRHRS